MAKRILPTPEELRQLLRYEPETGKLYWKERPSETFATARAASIWRSRFLGKEALACIDDGYRTGFLKGKRVRTHRIVWAIFYGEWPNGQIDHINRDRADNRICNLRVATNAQNQWNVVVRKESRTGLKGIVKSHRGKGWYARISVNGVRRNLGYFSSPESAHAAYCDAAKKHHGEFARVR